MARFLLYLLYSAKRSWETIWLMLCKADRLFLAKRREEYVYKMEDEASGRLLCCLSALLSVVFVAIVGLSHVPTLTASIFPFRVQQGHWKWLATTEIRHGLWVLLGPLYLKEAFMYVHHMNIASKDNSC